MNDQQSAEQWREFQSVSEEPESLEVDFSGLESAVEKALQTIDELRADRKELRLQLGILAEYLEKHGICRCENNGDYCEFHEMLHNAKLALK